MQQNIVIGFDFDLTISETGLKSYKEVKVIQQLVLFPGKFNVILFASEA
jgi:hypothetical protein